VQRENRHNWPRAAYEVLRLYQRLRPGISSLGLALGLYSASVQALAPAPHSPIANDSDVPLWRTEVIATEGETTLTERVVNFQAETLAPQRERFVAAENSLRRHQFERYQQLAAGLTEYPLYPYLRYQELKQRLSRVSDSELDAFFDSYADLPVADSLRRKLLSISARQGRWQRFLRYYQSPQNTRLQCQYRNAQIHTGQAEAAYPGIEKLWLVGHSQPRGCDRVFKHWQAAGKRTLAMVWQRLALALEEGHRPLARYLVRDLPPSEQKIARLWIKLHRTPQLLAKYQQRLSKSSHPMAATVFMSTVKRLARRQPVKAAELWHRSALRNQEDEATQYSLLATIAVTLARRQQAGAEDWFSIIPPKYLDESAREWRVRAALRQSQWQLALTALDTLSDARQQTDRWQYWRARVLEQLAHDDQAKQYYSTLAKRRSFFGFLAADHLGLPYSLKDQPHQVSSADLFTVSQDPGVLRAHELYQLGRRLEARREWWRAVTEMDNGQRSDAAKLAQLWGWDGQSILTMARTNQRDDIALRFPLLYQRQVMAHSEREQIDPAWIYGVIRRESAFVQDARSAKGAVGLMQLMPATAKSISRSLPGKYRGAKQLIQPETNLALGARYLRRMLKRFDGQTVLATAAYNAGQSRIVRWLPDETSLDAARWIENIPFRETRDYVTSVLAYTIIYADRLGLEQPRLSKRLTEIPAQDAL
jgi:soluble lytic murein transglycosylase